MPDRLESDSARPDGESGRDFASPNPERAAGTLGVDASELVDIADLMHLYGFSRQGIHYWLQAPDFPVHVRQFGNGTRVWKLEDVTAWRASRVQGQTQ